MKLNTVVLAAIAQWDVAGVLLKSEAVAVESGHLWNAISVDPVDDNEGEDDDLAEARALWKDFADQNQDSISLNSVHTDTKHTVFVVAKTIMNCWNQFINSICFLKTIFFLSLTMCKDATYYNSSRYTGSNMGSNMDMSQSISNIDSDRSETHNWIKRFTEENIDQISVSVLTNKKVTNKTNFEIIEKYVFICSHHCYYNRIAIAANKLRRQSSKKSKTRKLYVISLSVILISYLIQLN